MTIAKESRRCDVCNHEFKHADITVACSGIGPMSFGYCVLCGSIGAEPHGLEDVLDIKYVSFDIPADKYLGVSEKYMFINEVVQTLDITKCPKDVDTEMKIMLEEYINTRLDK